MSDNPEGFPEGQCISTVFGVDSSEVYRYQIQFILEGKSPQNSLRVCIKHGNPYKEYGIMDFPEQSWL